jgi:hypothetical protein
MVTYAHLDYDTDDSDWESGPDITPPPDPDAPNATPPSESTSEPTQPSISRPRHSIGSRVQALSLLEYGVPHHHITTLTEISKTRIYALRDLAIKRGYDPKVSKVIHEYYVTDSPRTGRPKTSQVVIDLILATVTKNSTTREWSCERIANEVSNTPGISAISARTVYNILTENGYSCYKKTRVVFDC